ncbi:UNVERIFIED_CONTAM: hypothetical protein FKN15_020699 [Acipenser sinensis]
MTPAQADQQFLENAKKLSMYGLDLHQAKDLEGVEIMLGVCSSGLHVYKDKLRINRFSWPKVLKISYKRNSFFIKIRPSEQEQYESTIGFKLPNYRASKKLWKVCVEHHTFFRLTSTEATTPRRFLALGSKFRYSGRTQAQTRQASSMIDRPAPLFQRTASKRASRSLDGEATTPRRFLALGSKFRYSGRTQAQTRQASSMIDRPAPLFQRTASKRASRSLDGVEGKSAQSDLKPVVERKEEGDWLVLLDSAHSEPAPQPSAMVVTPDRSPRPVSAPVISQAPPGEARAQAPATAKQDQREVTTAVTQEERKVEVKPAELPSRPEPVQVKPIEAEKKEEDDWFVLLDPSRSEPSPRPPVGGESHPPQPIEAEKKEEDDWFVLLDPSRSEPSPRPPAMVVTPDRSPRPVSAPVISQAPPGEARAQAPATAKQDQREVTTAVTQEERKVEVKPAELPSRPEPVQVKHPPVADEELVRMRKDLDKTQDEVMRRQASISELKRNFMESVPEPRPSEWDKRLSTHSPFRTLNINGQVQPGPDGPPLVKTQTVTISDVANSVKSEISTKEVPIVHTETKTITYESAQAEASGVDNDVGVLLSAQTITSETVSTTTTTQITKTVKGGISETRIEKRIVITGDADIDHDQALAQAIKEAKEQHPDMSVTKVVVHQETEALAQAIKEAKEQHPDMSVTKVVVHQETEVAEE